MVETFIDAPIPEFCGQIGFKMNAEQAFYMNNIQGYDNTRYYTDAQCKKLGGFIKGSNLHCVKMNDKRTKEEADYSMLCKGLNKKATYTPEECGSYGTPFTATEKYKMSFPDCKGKFCDKDVSVLNKHLRSYTEEECTLLGGFFMDTGFGLGQCIDKSGMNYSVACASLNSTLLPSISGATGYAGSWWTYFFGED
jgi:hypothetical protein